MVSNYTSWEEFNTECILSWLDLLLSRSWISPLANYRISLRFCTFLYLLPNRCPIHCNPPWANYLVLRSLILDPVWGFLFLLLFFFHSLQSSGSVADVYYIFSFVFAIILSVCGIFCWRFTLLELLNNGGWKRLGREVWEKAITSLCAVSED